MKKKIQFSLVYRDMWQSSGKFQPRKDQLERVAPAIIDMGCFARVETNGGAFEQVNLHQDTVDPTTILAQHAVQAVGAKVKASLLQ